MRSKGLVSSLMLHLAIASVMYNHPMSCVSLGFGWTIVVAIASVMYNHPMRASRKKVNGNFEKLVKEPERVLRSFSVHGTEIKAYSKKDALKRHKHLMKSKETQNEAKQWEHQRETD